MFNLYPKIFPDASISYFFVTGLSDIVALACNPVGIVKSARTPKRLPKKVVEFCLLVYPTNTLYPVKGVTKGTPIPISKPDNFFCSYVGIVFAKAPPVIKTVDVIIVQKNRMLDFID